MSASSTPPKRISNSRTWNSPRTMDWLNDIDNNSASVENDDKKAENKLTVSGLASPSLLSRVDALIEKSRQRDEWESFSGKRDNHSQNQGEKPAAKNFPSPSLNFTKSIQDDVGIIDNVGDDNKDDDAEQNAIINKSLTSISESLYLHEKCGRLHRALFMTNHNATGEDRVSTSNLVILLEDAQEAAEQSYQSLMKARRDLLISYIGNDAAEAMIASSNIKRNTNVTSVSEGGMNNKKENENLNSPSNRMSTLRSTLQHMVALPHTSTVSLKQQLTNNSTTRRSPRSNISNEITTSNVSYVKVAEEMYNTATDNNINEFTDKKIVDATREIRLLSPRAKLKNPKIATPNERLESLNKSLSRMFSEDSKHYEQENDGDEDHDVAVENGGKSNDALMKEVERNLKAEMKEDLQFEKEYNATMEAFSKTVEENVESVANLVENNNNILGESNISVDNSDNNENKLVPLEQLTTDPMPWTGKVGEDDSEKKAIEVSSSSPSLKRLKKRLNTTSLPSPLQRLQDFRKSLQNVASYQSRSYATDSCNSKLPNGYVDQSKYGSSTSLFNVKLSPHEISNSVDEREKLPLPRHKVLLNKKKQGNILSVDGETQSRLTFLNSRVDNIKATIKRIADGDAGSGENTFSTYESDAIITSKDATAKNSSSMISPKSPKEILQNMVDEQKY